MEREGEGVRGEGEGGGREERERGEERGGRRAYHIISPPISVPL